ncbi:hypothetical protein [Methylococcus geothermalis]|uniref:Yip1 domain-containing protein n=1 Tax=Methylococcus geothermalis TaxID=2681310 RepID=A0A858Q9M1_9GAMM|nr:hypothetical protein [Methylococcus geothermalis]QJD30424.1 hypothetical protein GNH96_10865 [Methylococcus geothermalis]
MALIRLFIEICLFRRGPQDVPSSMLLFWLVAGAYLLVGFILLGLEVAWLPAIVESLVELAMLLGFVWLLLALFKKTPRWQKTATAMLGSDVVISTPAIPLVGWTLAVPDATAIHLLLFGMMLWHVAVVAHIFRHALSKPWATGLLLAVAYVAGSYSVMMTLFPPSAV